MPNESESQSVSEINAVHELSHEIRGALHVIHTSTMLLKRLGRDVDNFDELVDAIAKEERKASDCLTELLDTVRPTVK